MEPLKGYDVNISWNYIFKIVMLLIVKWPELLHHTPPSESVSIM